MKIRPTAAADQQRVAGEDGAYGVIVKGDAAVGVPGGREALQRPSTPTPADGLIRGEVRVRKRARALGDRRAHSREMPLEGARAGDVVGVAVRIER